jgi:hypothetical protein
VYYPDPARVAECIRNQDALFREVEIAKNQATAALLHLVTTTPSIFHLDVRDNGFGSDFELFVDFTAARNRLKNFIQNPPLHQYVWCMVFEAVNSWRLGPSVIYSLFLDDPSLILHW